MTSGDEGFISLILRPSTLRKQRTVTNARNNKGQNHFRSCSAGPDLRYPNEIIEDTHQGTKDLPCYVTIGVTRPRKHEKGQTLGKRPFSGAEFSRSCNSPDDMLTKESQE